MAAWRRVPVRPLKCLRQQRTSVVSAGREAGARDAASGNAVEELVSSFRTWIDGVRLLRSSAAEDLMEKIELDLVHDAHLRPHQGLGGATPAEVYFGRAPSHLAAIPPPRGRPGEGRTDSPFRVDYLGAERLLSVLVRKAA